MKKISRIILLAFSFYMWAGCTDEGAQGSCAETMARLYECEGDDMPPGTIEQCEEQYSANNPITVDLVDTCDPSDSCEEFLACRDEIVGV